MPRPETEMLVAQGLAMMQGKPVQRILDLGTGSGAIPIALLNELPQAAAMATDISAEALEMARAERGPARGRGPHDVPAGRLVGGGAR